MISKSTPVYKVDSFTHKQFSGNPAGVCLLSEPKDDVWMQAIAREMNLSETAFVIPVRNGYSLRWFTPTVEVDLCGHATLAASHILWETGNANFNDTLLFHTRSGLLKARKKDEWIELDFPPLPEEHIATPPELLPILGAAPLYVGKNKYDLLVEIESEETLRNLSPDFEMIKRITNEGVIVTAKSTDKNYDFISRYFAPGVGINEDPATGAAHCCLATYWQKRLGKNEFIAYQASARGGVVKVKLVNNRVFLGGQAVTIMKGELV